MTPPATLNEPPASDIAVPVSLKVGPLRWQVRSAATTAGVEELLREPDRFLTQKELLLHDTFLVTLGRVTLPVKSHNPLLLRRSNYGKPAARWRDCFRTAGALRAFRIALALERAGVPTPRVMAAGVRRVGLMPQAGYLLVEEIPAAVSLAKQARTPAGVPRATLDRVAGAIARMHAQGFFHGDLTINNVLLDPAGQPWFIDLERARRGRGPVSWRQAIEDFHRFARHFVRFSTAGRLGALRLLKIYTTARGWRGRDREFIAALDQRMKHKVLADRKP